MAKTSLNSRSGSTVDKALAFVLVLGLSFTLTESKGFAQNMDNVSQDKIGDSTTLALSPAAALNEKLAAMQAKLQALDQAEAPEVDVEANTAGVPAAPSTTPKIVSTVLLEALESTLQKMQAAANPDQPAASAEQAIFYLNEKLEALDRMIYLLEQKRAMQTASGNYQQRLEVMQKRIEERDTRALAGN